MKRYIVNMEFFVYAENDKQAKKQAKKITDKLNNKYDNQPKIIEMYQNDFGSLQAIKLKF